MAPFVALKHFSMTAAVFWRKQILSVDGFCSGIRYRPKSWFKVGGVFGALNQKLIQYRMGHRGEHLLVCQIGCLLDVLPVKKSCSESTRNAGLQQPESNPPALLDS
jgi:hypothetical protein